MTEIAPDVAHWLALLSDGKAVLSKSEMWDIATIISRLNDENRKANGRINLLEQERDAATAELARSSEQAGDMVDKATAWDACVKAREEERERCAKIAEPKGPRPCDCEYGACYCRNAGDAAAVASWDADMAVARAIRAPVSEATEGGK